MEISLYHPELGYYARAAQKTGRAGDFFTSVDVGPIFGELLAKQFAEMWQSSAKRGRERFSLERVENPSRPLSISSRPARATDAWRAISSTRPRRTDPDFYSAIRLSLVEQSAAARAAQAEHARDRTPAARAQRLRTARDVHGVIYANELLDALPTHSVVMTDAGLREVFIDLAPSTVREPQGHPEQGREQRSEQAARFVERSTHVHATPG